MEELQKQYIAVNPEICTYEPDMINVVNQLSKFLSYLNEPGHWLKALELIKTFNNYEEIFNQTIEKLQTTGLTLNSCRAIKKTNWFYKKIGTDKIPKTFISSANDVHNIFRYYFSGIVIEQFISVSLNSALYIQNTHLIAIGTNDKIENIYSKDVIRNVILDNCSKCIVIHNHPSGIPDPSDSDLEVTKYLNKCMKLLDLELLDHVIIGNNCFYSLKEQNFI